MEEERERVKERSICEHREREGCIRERWILRWKEGERGSMRVERIYGEMKREGAGVKE